MNLSFNSSKSTKPIAFTAIISLIMSLIAVVGFNPAVAATNVELVVHVPVTASESETVTVTPYNGTTVTAKAKYADDYGAFAVLSVPATPTEVTITSTSLPNQPVFTRLGTEIWLDSSGTAHKSRYLAQSCSLDVHYIADSNSDATNADLEYSEDNGATQTISVSTVSSNTATFSYEGNCNAKTVSFNATISGTDKTSFSVNLKTAGEVWIKDSWPLARTTQAWADGYAVIHWYRQGGYTGYGVHTWNLNGSGYSGNSVTWASPLLKEANDDAWGAVFRIPIVDASTIVPYIIHAGDSKDPSGLDQMLDLEKTGGEVWLKSGSADPDGYAKFTVPVLSDVEADLGRQKGIWLTPGVIAWPYPITAAEYDGHAILHYSEYDNLEVDETGVQNADASVVLEYAAGLTNTLRTKYPYLRDYVALKVPADQQANVKTWVRGQVAIETLKDDKSAPLRISGVQLGDVLDALYPGAKDITPGVTWNGNTPTITVWAPTAKNLHLELFDNSGDGSGTSYDMTRDDATGAWSVTGDSSWNLKQYMFVLDVYAPSTQQVETNYVSDPYAVSLNMNGTRSQIVNLESGDLKPAGWDSLVKPTFARIADATIYELMIRDFSITDESVTEAYRGGFMAFSETNSNGMQHLAALADAGLTHLQIGPAFDIATVNEDKSTWQEVDWDALEAYNPDSSLQKTAVGAIKDADGFNWGYDPLHYTAPDGSFSVDPDSESRILEFREMVKGLSSIGLRISMDVVYNHTSANGQASTSVLDRIVPGYYHRLNSSGAVETSTCCKNTATERMMMAKLNLDSIITWAKEYKVDGFRFDLMGHQPKAQMEEIRAALDALTIANDGVDGKKILLYGEGWNFGEVTSGARFPNAIQSAMDGTGIGTFDDRMRDWVRGGGPFDSDPRKQGFASGMYGNSNGWAGNGTSVTDQRLNLDGMKIALAGGMATYRIKSWKNITVSGQGVPYGTASSGYTKDPIEQIAYVDAHDNETLYDALAYKLPYDTTMADRIRYQVLGLSVPTMGQGIPFVLAGTDLLRSKSMDKNSYNSGDWFNVMDWTYETNGFGRGIPMEVSNLSQATNLLGRSSLVPTGADMQKASQMWQDFLKVRYSSKLFRLGTGDAVSKRVKFLTAGSKAPLGLLAMQILDEGKGIKSIDSKYKSVIVLFNASKKAKTYKVDALSKAKISLHPIQKTGVDSVVKTSKFSKGTFTIPALTTAVFVQK